MQRPVAVSATPRGGLPTDSSDSVVTLDQVPRWNDTDQSLGYENGEAPFLNSYFPDPLASTSGADGSSSVSRFPVDHEINSRIYLWRGNPWNLEVDAVVNSTNENMDEAHSSPGLHAAAGSGLAEECATLGGCRTGMAKVTNAYDLPARRIIHTVGPKYAVKYHTAAENALSHCYRSCLELLVDSGLRSIAMGCIYTEAKNYPREPAAHVAIRTVRRFLEKQKNNLTAVVFCTTSTTDTEIYKRLLPLYFPRDKHEEQVALSKLPADVGDENGETIIDERKIRIKPLPKKSVSRPSDVAVDLPVSDVGLAQKKSSNLDSFLDPAFMSLIKDPDQRRLEQWEKTAEAQRGFNCAKLLGYGDLEGPPLSAAEEYSLHSRYLSKANSLNLSEIAEMKIVYRGGVDSEGRPVMVVVGAHFLLRCLDLERFVLYVVKEFEALIQKPYTIVYFHSAASLQVQPDLGWMKRLQQILGRKHQRNLHAIYVLHPSFGLNIEIVAAQDIVFALAQSGVCAAFNRETNERICFLNVSPDEVIRSLFYNKNNDSLITVSVYASDSYSSLKCRSTRTEYIRRVQPDAGFALFESESLKWPGFVEFDDVNGKVLTYSAQDSIYKVFDLKNYTLLYSVADKNVQEIKISPGIMLLIYSKTSSHVPLKILSIEDGTVLKSFNHLIHRNSKVDFIEQFNEKLLVKQENENLQILDVRTFELKEVSKTEFMTPSAFIFLYENQLFLTFRNRTVAVWNFRGELVTSFEDHLLWHPDCNTNNIYITSDQDLIISYCKADSDESLSEGNAGSINVSNILTGKCLAKIRASNSFPITKECNCSDDCPGGGCNSKKRKQASRIRSTVTEALEDITALFYDEDRNEIYTGNRHGLVHVWSN